jgi:O-antigen/teichoic acid export membrane protein
MLFFSSNILLNLFFVIVLKAGVLGILYGILLNSAIFSVVIYIYYFRKIGFSFDYNILKAALKYSLPLIPYSILNILFESVDKFFLNADSGAKTSGIYYIALTFAAIFSSAKESVVNAFTPWLFANIKERDESYLADIINVIFAGLGIAAIGVAWFSKEVLMLLSSNPDFVEAYRFIPFTVIGLYIIFLGQLYNMKTFYFGKYNRYLFLATLAGIAADIVACYLLVKPYGIHGAVFSRVIAFTVHVAVLMYLSTLETEKRNIYESKKLILTMLIFCAFMPVPLLIGQGYVFILLKIVAYALIAFLFTYYINLKFNLVEGLKKYKAIR